MKAEFGDRPVYEFEPALRAGGVLGVLLLAAACGGGAPLDGAGIGAALEAQGGVVLAEGTPLPRPADPRLTALLEELGAHAATGPAAAARIVVDYPREGSLFPRHFVPPTVLWHDEASGADTWLVRIDLASGAPILVLVPGAPAPRGWVDKRAMGKNNALYEPTPYQASAHAWTPPRELWDVIQDRSVDAPLELTIAGFARSGAHALLSHGSTTFATSADEVGAPVFYRDVPLMPAVSETDGVISPLSQDAVPIIEWRLKDFTRPGSKVVLTGMPTCANCHSFSRDGRTLAMDVDGPTGDKGMYGIAPIEKRTVIGLDRVLTWNSFKGKSEDQRTIGFLSRVAPDGRHVVSTVNESLYVANFTDYRFVQVFFPTRGILAWAKGVDGEVRALPGADDPRFVHCNAVWSPDGASLVFCRAEAFDPPPQGQEQARYPNDEREPKVHFDLYRMPFADGRGGTPVPVAGASDNGMSNSFPKVSPDGRWIVFTKCANGQLLRPDGKLFIVPFEGGEARQMRCNTDLMNSWHTFSPNGRWLAFTSKINTPYTQLLLTHLDDDGNDTPAILVPDCTASNRAVNLPEFLNAPYDAIEDISVPAVGHGAKDAYFQQASYLMSEGQFAEAVPFFRKIVEIDPESLPAQVNLAMGLRQAGDRMRAAEHFRAALALDPADPLALAGMGLLREDVPCSAADIARLRAAERASPRDAGATRRLAIALAQAGRVDEALPLLDRSLREGDAAADRAAAYVLLSAHDVQGAVQHLERHVLHTPGDAFAAQTAAWLLAASRDRGYRDGERALHFADKAWRATDGREPGALDALAAALAETRRYAEAVATAEAALKLAESSDAGLAKAIRRRLQRYRQGLPL